MIKPEHKQFLLGPASAGKTRHSGRMLYDHLAGTHALLEAWGNSEDICNAGLFHSIYGTRRFRHQSWPLTDRETIRKLIGAEAEALAYAFCMADRKAFLGNKPILIDQDTWNTLWLSVEILPALCEIEAANLIEQGSGSKWLARLRDSDISDAAKRAIARHLSAEAA